MHLLLHTLHWFIGAVNTSFVMAKTRVAPIKQASVSHSELIAAHSLAKLVCLIGALKCMFEL